MKVPQLLMVCLLPILIASCSRYSGVDECQVFSPIYPAIGDTLETKAQVLKHWKRGQKACGWKPLDRNMDRA